MKLESQFAVAAFNAQVDKMSREQAQAMCKLLFEHNQAQKETYLQLLKQGWDIGVTN